MHLYLTGYRGCGKSTVARSVAEPLGVEAIDLDRLIEQRQGRRIADIFATAGETAFRDAESSALEEVARAAPAVVALGGGAVLREENRRRIAATGRCVWLVAEPELLARRIARDQRRAATRPSLTGRDPAGEVAEVLDARAPIYAAAADWKCPVDGRSVAEIAAAILAWLDEPLR